MMFKSRAMIALLVTYVVALALIGILYSVNNEKLDWFPQALVTLAALVGASWFAGNRLDLFEKDIRQRQDIGEGQLIANERANFNSAVKEAVTLMSSEKSPSVVAGQRWLHGIANVGPTEANLVQSLLCNYLTNALATEAPPSGPRPQLRLYQSALNLLFRAPDRERFSECDAEPDLSSSYWRGLDFTELDLRGATFAGGDFTDATIIGTRFDSSNLRETQWSNVGGPSRTLIRDAQLCGATASSATFTNIDFSQANLSHKGRRTEFRSCTFKHCDFKGSDWTGATFDHCIFLNCNFDGDTIWKGAVLQSPKFHQCSTLTSDLCAQAKLSDPDGLPQLVHQELSEKGLI